MTFLGFSMTYVIFHDFPGLENGLTEFPNFPSLEDILENIMTSSNFKISGRH